MADILITPLNDSFIDLDVLGTVDRQTLAVTGTSHYSQMVQEARLQRHTRMTMSARIGLCLRNPVFRCWVRATQSSWGRDLVNCRESSISSILMDRCRTRDFQRILSARSDRTRFSR